jgi:hypothetical protein
MIDTMKFACIAVLLLSSFLTTKTWNAVAQQAPKNKISDRSTFTADEDSFEPSAPIPPKALAALARTVAGTQGLAFASVKGKPVLADLFRAVEVNLGAAGDAALVVGGVGRMSGADNDWFWIVRSPQQQPKVILWCGGNSLELLDSKSEGYRDVRCTWSSASETSTSLYRYVAGRYRLQHKKWTERAPDE